MAQGTASGLVLVSGSLLEELLTEIRALVANIGGILPDATGRVRVLLEGCGAPSNTEGVSQLSSPASGALPVNIAGIGVVAAQGATSAQFVITMPYEGGQPANTNVGSLMNISSYNALRPGIVTS